MFSFVWIGVVLAPICIGSHKTDHRTNLGIDINITSGSLQHCPRIPDHLSMSDVTTDNFIFLLPPAQDASSSKLVVKMLTQSRIHFVRKLESCINPAGITVHYDYWSYLFRGREADLIRQVAWDKIVSIQLSPSMHWDHADGVHLGK